MLRLKQFMLVLLCGYSTLATAAEYKHFKAEKYFSIGNTWSVDPVGDLFGKVKSYSTYVISYESSVVEGQGICSEFHNSLYKLEDRPVELLCFSNHKKAEEFIQQKGHYFPHLEFHFKLSETEDKKNSLRYSFVGTDAKKNKLGWDLTDVTAWNFEADSEETYLAKSNFLMSGVVNLKNNREKIEDRYTEYMALASGEYKNCGMKSDGDLKLVRKGAGDCNDSSVVDHDVIKQENIRHKPNVYRALVEAGLLMGSYQAYYGSASSFPEDVEYVCGKSTFKERFRLDDNQSFVNGFAHMYVMGLNFNQAFSSNGVDPLTSALGTLALSHYWEYVVECDEVYSINDTVATTLGGIFIGETFNQFSLMLRRFGRKSKIAKALAVLLSPFQSVNNWLDGKDVLAGTGDPLEKITFDNSQVDFEFFSRILFGRNVTQNHNYTTLFIGAEGEIIHIKRDRAKAPQGWTSRNRIPMNEVYFDLGFGSDTHDIETLTTPEINFFTKMAFAAYHNSKVKGSGANRKGYSMILAPTHGVEYHDRVSDKNKNWYGIVNILGGTIDLEVYKGNTVFRFVLDHHGGYAMAKPYAWDKFREAQVTEKGLPSALTRSDGKPYYFFEGQTSSFKFAVENENHGLEIKAVVHDLNMVSTEYDRFPDETTRDLKIKDRYVTGSIGYKYKMENTEWKVLLQGTKSQGTARNIHPETGAAFKVDDHSTDIRIMLEYIYRFK